jgi:hypothetical protein
MCYNSMSARAYKGIKIDSPDRDDGLEGAEALAQRLESAGLAGAGHQ